FFCQAEDGIRDPLVTGVQTCALPIYVEVTAEAARPVGVVGAMLSAVRHQCRCCAWLTVARVRPELSAIARSICRRFIMPPSFWYSVLTDRACGQEKSSRHPRNGARGLASGRSRRRYWWHTCSQPAPRRGIGS